MRQWRLFTGLLLILVSSPQVAAVDDNTLSIPLNFWSSQRVLSQAVGNILQRQGLVVEYKDISAIDQWGAMQRGMVHFQVEVWQSSMQGILNSMLAGGHVLDLGAHSVRTREEWWYPLYVEKQCPGLPDWQALQHCASLFANGSQRGIYINGPWEYDDATLIRALNLNFTLHRVSTERQLWETLDGARRQNKPILLLNWTPNWTDRVVPGHFVEFPPYHPECDIEPRWGISPDLVGDCGNPADGWLKKVAWPGLQTRHPCVLQMLRKLDFTADMMVDASSMVVVQGWSEAQAVNAWLGQYAEVVSKWQSVLHECLLRSAR